MREPKITDPDLWKIFVTHPYPPNGIRCWNRISKIKNVCLFAHSFSTISHMVGRYLSYLDNNQEEADRCCHASALTAGTTDAAIAYCLLYSGEART